ncbi:MAG: 50S ribosomal protein L28 [Magnetococcales bacterium]|nr:50S ribosomal protein L28 [Magnetococcales bacterium]MBF0151040.1 50S ribosomal protein L28 [Magnetococcales bacterium]MBF0173113.1 50S ribosomal protein L28 [Magnetococcales bacterium]MBF0346236.1 50S ribosomal protein L28 [Magnetococcales bacterium]MBF0632848.1 50S ribosomal protein L28 [Magnetococcales bacterium]
MARKHVLGGKAPQTGNKVSHSNRKSRRKWLPNMQKKAVYSMALGRSIRLSMPASLIRTLDFAGGLDNFLLSQSTEDLSRSMRRLQALIREQVQKE